MNYTNIKLIMDRLTRHPLLQDIPYETVIDYAGEFMRIVGIAPSFIDKTAIIDIHNYRGQLPCDYYEMVQVRLYDLGCDKPNRGVPELSPVFRYTTDSFHMSPDKPKVSDLTYKIQGDCIFTSPLKEGQIEIAYMAIPIDEDGYPLIPDNSSYTRALEAYIKKQWFTIQFDMGKITQQAMQKADQDYAFYVGQAQTNMIMPTVDQMQSITNLWNTLIPRYQDHRKGFLHEGTQEHLKTR